MKLYGGWLSGWADRRAQTYAVFTHIATHSFPCFSSPFTGRASPVFFPHTCPICFISGYLKRTGDQYSSDVYIIIASLILWAFRITSTRILIFKIQITQIYPSQVISLLSTNAFKRFMKKAMWKCSHSFISSSPSVQFHLPPVCWTPSTLCSTLPTLTHPHPTGKQVSSEDRGGGHLQPAPVWATWSTWSAARGSGQEGAGGL